MNIGGIEITREWAIIILSMVGTGLIAFFVWRSMLEPKPETGRLKDLKQRRESLRQGLLGATTGNRNEMKHNSLSFMRQFVERLDLMRGGVARETGEKLARAGLRTKDALVAFMFFKLALPFVGGAVGLIAVNMLAADDMDYMTKIFLALMIGGVGFMLPDLYVKNLAKNRRKLMQKGLPDALDLLVVCAQAGLSLDAAIARVAKEIVFSSPTVGEEFSLTALELGFLPERRQALDNLKERTGLKEIGAVVSTLIQSEKYGTPLAYALQVLTAEFRRERLMRAEEKAARLPAIMTLPLALFILPVLFMVVIGPAIIQAMQTLEGSGSAGLDGK